MVAANARWLRNSSTPEAKQSEAVPFCNHKSSWRAHTGPAEVGLQFAGGADTVQSFLAAYCCPQVPRMHQAGVHGLPEVQRPGAVHPLLLWRAPQRRLRSGGCWWAYASAAVCLGACWEGRDLLPAPALLPSATANLHMCTVSTMPTSCPAAATAAVLGLYRPLRKV